MTNEERDLIDKFVARVGGAPTGAWSRVPQSQPGLPPIDPEADRYIAQQFQTHPEARYRITQMAVVQEAALTEAANRIQRLQAELEATRQQAQQAQQGGQHRGFLGSLFGGGGAAAAPQPMSQPGQGPWNQGSAPQQQQYAPPQYAQPAPMAPPPGVQPGMFGRGGSGFLGSALTTAAGVAGGVVAGNVLMDMFSGHGGGMGGGMFGGGMGGMGGGFGGGMPIQGDTTIINNYGDAGGGGVDPAWDNSTQGDSGGGGWDDNSGGGGGFDDSNI